MSEAMQLLDLMGKPKEYVFTDAERLLIKKHFKKSSVHVFYCINRNPMQKNNENNGRSFLLVYDFMAGSERGRTLRNNMQTIVSRELSDIEYEWMISNYGKIGQRFLKTKYTKLSELIADDLADGVVTPQEAIDAVHKNLDIISL